MQKRILQLMKTVLVFDHRSTSDPVVNMNSRGSWSLHLTVKLFLKDLRKLVLIWSNLVSTVSEQEGLLPQPITVYPTNYSDVTNVAFVVKDDLRSLLSVLLSLGIWDLTYNYCPFFIFALDYKGCIEAMRI